MILLPKSNQLDQPDAFRNIALTNTHGKLFFSIVSKRLTDYMVDNKFIDTTVQKGFIPKLSGCVEHTYLLNEALKDARRHRRQITVAWVDLANAYGSVAHNLIQFALEWYHVPVFIRKLIFNYYEILRAMVACPNWKTKFFRYGIGLFQGCVLSTILFDATFNLCLDFLKQSNNPGYMFKGTNVVLSWKAYADDLTLIGRTPSLLQRMLDTLQIFLSWTRTMKAKPSKCKHLAMKIFGPNPGKYVPHTDASYSAFDAKVSINNQPIDFIGDHLFKFLGRKIKYDLSESEQTREINETTRSNFKIVDEQPINGFMKLWLYQNYILSFLSWPFMIYDLNLSEAKRLEVLANRYLKKWARLPRPANTSILYRSRKFKGMQLTAISLHYKKMQILKAHTVKYSKDLDLKTVYELQSSRDVKKLRVWTPAALLEKVVEIITFEKKFAGQTSKLGLGFVKKKQLKDPLAQQRKDITQRLRKLDEEERLLKVYDLAKQGKWTSWDEVMELDLSWKNLIYALPPKLISFALNASCLTLPTPDNLRLWGKSFDSRCSLCSIPKCTLFHILCNCPYSLHTKRYTWRHDSVLRTLEPFVRSQINKQNETKEQMNKSGFITFVRAGEKSNQKSVKKITRLECLLNGSSDWEILIDYDSNPSVFPTYICATDERPDIVIWSKSSKRVIMLELTVPAEENVADAHNRKTIKYDALVSSCLAQGWHPVLLPFEIGCKGFVGFSLISCCKKLGMLKREITRISKLLSKVALRCSYLLYLSRNDRDWKPLDLHIVLEYSNPRHIDSTNAVFASAL